MKVLVIPDVHLKPWMFDRAAEIMRAKAADLAVCLMDIPDDWRQEFNLELYEQTYDRAIAFEKEFQDTLWCYGNHDLSYIWNQPESGFSRMAGYTVNQKLHELLAALPDENRLAYIHRIDNVLFVHGGLREDYITETLPDIDMEDIDGVIDAVNGQSGRYIWTETSPVWCRPQYYTARMYKEKELLQVVGHTPVERITRDRNIISCDVFSTDNKRVPYGTQEYPIIDTQTWRYRTIR